MIMKFFKYMPAKYAMETLRTGLIKVATTADVNDPNEIMPWLTINGKDAQVDRIWEMARSRLANDFGFISLSTNWDSNPMWGLYADKFRGMALVFDYDCKDSEPALFQVKYSNWRYHLTEGELDEKNKDNDMYERFRAMYANKDKTWAFENEWRRLVEIKKTTPKTLENGEIGYFVDICKYLSLTGVVIGPNSNMSLSDVSDAVQGCIADGFAVTQLGYDTRCFALQFKSRLKWLQGAWHPDGSTVI